jgi:hypothetical protein
MPEYGKILAFLAKNPPQFESERAMHASLLELLASCLRSEMGALESPKNADDESGDIAKRITEDHIRWVNFN